DALAVHERAVRRSDVLDPHAVAARLDARVRGRGELVLGKRDVVLARAPNRDRGGVQDVLLTRRQRGAAKHDQPAAERQQLAFCASLRREDEALLRQTEVTACGADNAPDEEVEEHQEGDLQREEEFLDVDGRGSDHGTERSNTTSVAPSVIVSPLCSFVRDWRRPLTATPFVESRSTIQYVVPSWRSSAWRRDTLASGTWTSQSRERPMTTRRLSISWRLSFTVSVTTSRSTGTSSGSTPSVGGGA